MALSRPNASSLNYGTAAVFGCKSAAWRGGRGDASRRIRTPNLLQALRSPAIPFVELIADRVRRVIILMIVLCGRERGYRLDLRHHRPFEAVGDLLLRRFSKSFFLVISDKNHASIGVAFIAKLAVWIERIDVVPILVEQFCVGHPGRVVGDPDRLLVALVVAIGRVWLGT